MRADLWHISRERVNRTLGVRSGRSPLGYHHLADIFGFTPKLPVWDGRYGQIYLCVEEQESNCR